MNLVTESRQMFEHLRQEWSRFARPVKVLVVEDDPTDAQMITLAIKGTRVTAVLATSGSEAIKYLSSDRFDLCILDLKLNDVSGPEVLATAKERHTRVPFVVLTGMDDRSPLIKEALEAGANCIIQKPLTKDNVQMIFGGI